MINFSAIMLDEEQSTFEVEIEAATWETALNGLEKVYPKECCVQLESFKGTHVFYSVPL